MATIVQIPGKTKRLLLSAGLLLLACGAPRKQAETPVKDKASIMFVTFSMHRDPGSGISVLVQQDKKQVEGTVKGKEQASMLTGNYLALHVYQNKKLVDSLTIDHPLFKHFEYLDEHNKFMVKDTILTQAVFSVRLQVQGSANSLHVYEVLREQPRTLISIIEL